jgi:hypothetical protein
MIKLVPIGRDLTCLVDLRNENLIAFSGDSRHKLRKPYLLSTNSFEVLLDLWSIRKQYTCN